MAEVETYFCNYEDCPGRHKSENMNYWIVGDHSGRYRTGLHRHCMGLIRNKEKLMDQNKEVVDQEEQVVYMPLQRGDEYDSEWDIIRKVPGKEHWELYQRNVTGVGEAYDIAMAMNLAEKMKNGVISS